MIRLERQRDYRTHYGVRLVESWTPWWVEAAEWILVLVLVAGIVLTLLSQRPA